MPDDSGLKIDDYVLDYDFRPPAIGMIHSKCDADLVKRGYPEFNVYYFHSQSYLLSKRQPLVKITQDEAILRLLTLEVANVPEMCGSV